MPVTKYIWDPVNDCVLQETDENGVTQVTYNNEPGPYGRLVSEHRNGETKYYHYDALGSTRQLTDDTETVTDTFTYDAWGNEIARTGDTPTPYRWVGERGYQFDAEIDSYYVRARTYEPVIARWWSVDLIWVESRQGQYMYVLNNSSNTTDPSGQKSARQCCLAAFSIHPLPSESDDCKLYTAPDGTKLFGRPISMTAAFTSPCECCEYRQMVKENQSWRYILHNGKFGPWNKYKDSTNVWREDYNPSENLRYGRRKGQKNRTGETYLPEPRTTGCKYDAFDNMGIVVAAANSQAAKGIVDVPGTLGIEIQLDSEFVGAIIDTCKPVLGLPVLGLIPNVVASETWHVKCKATFPMFDPLRHIPNPRGPHIDVPPPNIP